MLKRFGPHSGFASFRIIGVLLCEGRVHPGGLFGFFGTQRSACLLGSQRFGLRRFEIRTDESEGGHCAADHRARQTDDRNCKTTPPLRSLT